MLICKAEIIAGPLALRVSKQVWVETALCRLDRSERGPYPWPKTRDIDEQKKHLHSRFYQSPVVATSGMDIMVVARGGSAIDINFLSIDLTWWTDTLLEFWIP